MQPMRSLRVTSGVSRGISSPRNALTRRLRELNSEPIWFCTNLREAANRRLASCFPMSSCYVMCMKRIGKVALLLAAAFIMVGSVIAGAFLLTGAVAAAAVLVLYASIVVLVRRITRKTGPRPTLTAGT
jgi:hypothetical protein